MSALWINGLKTDAPPGSTILTACRSAGIEVPTLCHDDRLEPCAACRLCLVKVQGVAALLPACSALVTEGMVVETHAPEVEATRRTVLEMLAANYPAADVERWPDKPFHALLRHYGVTAGHGHPGAGWHFKDATHPYLHVDMDRCITCFRCVRICDEVQGQFVWHATGRGSATSMELNGSTLLGSSCVSCGACADSCPTGAIEDQSVLRWGTPTAWTRTTCPYCGTGCEMEVGVRGGRITQVRPVLDAPVSKGHLCVKGRYAFDFVHAPARVTSPMIRREHGWQKVSWDEALDFIAINLTAILEESGADSIGVLGSARGTNEESYLAQKFARVALGTNNVDCCARVCHAPTAAGMKQTLGTGAATNSFDDIEHAATILVCGCNPTENHPIVGARIKQAVLRGAKLIVIDPREIELTKHAAVHLALRPGTNVPLLHALAHVIVAEGLMDAAALRERVDGFETFREFIGAWTPERAEELTGVPAEKIRAAARLYAGHKPSMCFHGLGMTEHVQGTEGVMCLVNLALLTGNFGRAGTGVNPLRGQNNVQGSAHMGCEPGHLTGYLPLEQGRDVFEAVWQAPVPHTPGLNLMQMMDAAAAGRLRALWAIGYDVALTNPNAHATREALGRLELVIVQDLFMNELAREFGHVFLPACSSFERDGTFMNSERRVQRVRRAVEPPGEAKPDWEILCLLGRRMGFVAEFDFCSPEEVWDEVRSVWPAGAGISYARLDHGGLQWPCPDESHPGTSILHAASFPHGPRAPLKLVAFAPGGEMVNDEFPLLLTTGRTLYQFNAGTMTMRTPNALLRGADTVDVAPADAQRLGLRDGAMARVRSRHGAAELRVRVDERLQPGEVFATFHAVETALNNVTGPGRDRTTQTPEYKVVAVNLSGL